MAEQLATERVANANYEELVETRIEVTRRLDSVTDLLRANNDAIGAETVELRQSLHDIAENTNEGNEGEKKQSGLLKALVGFGKWSKTFAERNAKKALEMGSKVKKWGGDQVKKIQNTAKNLLDLLMKGLGLLALWLIFDWISKQDWAKIFEDIKAKWAVIQEEWKETLEVLEGIWDLVKTPIAFFWLHTFWNAIKNRFGFKGPFGRAWLWLVNNPLAALFGKESHFRQVINWIRKFFGAEGGIAKLLVWVRESKVGQLFGKGVGYVRLVISWIKTFFGANGGIAKLLVWLRESKVGQLFGKGIGYVRLVINWIKTFFGAEGGIAKLLVWVRESKVGQLFGKGVGYARLVINWIKSFFGAEAGLGKLIVWLRESKVGQLFGKETGVVRTVIRWIKGFFGLTGGLGLLYTWLAGDAGKGVKGLFGEGSKIRGIINWIKGFFGAEGGISKAIGWIKESKKLKAVQTFLKNIGSKFLRFLGPVTWIIAGYEAVTAFMDAFNAEEGSLWDKTVAGLTAGIKALVDFFVFDMIGMFEKGVKWMISKVLSLFGISEKETKASDWYNYSITDKLREWVWAAIDGIADFLKFKWVGNLWGEMVAGATDLWSWLTTSVIDPVKKFFTDMFSWASEEDEGDSWIVKTIKGVMTTVKEWLTSMFKFDSTSDILATAFNVYSFLPNIIFKGLTAVASWLASLFTLDAAAKEIANAGKFSLGDLVMKAIDQIVEWFKKIINFDFGKLFKDALGKVGEVGSKIADFFEFGDDEKELPEVQQQKGGIVKSGTVIKSILHGPEAVIPLGSEGAKFMGKVLSKSIPTKMTENIGNGGGGTNVGPTVINSSKPLAQTTVAMNSSSIDIKRAVLAGANG